MTEGSGTAVVLFTRDLRVHDNPALHAAVRGSEQVVPLFVLDTALLGTAFNRPNRAHFLARCLSDLDGALRERGAHLVVRRGDVVEQVLDVVRRVNADVVHLAGDISGYAVRREDRLHTALHEDDVRLEVHEDSLFVVPPGRITAAGKDHMAVFTPYFRRWEKEPHRDPLAAPRQIAMPRIAAGRLPSARSVCAGEAAPELAEGGETRARVVLGQWLGRHAEDYDDGHDDLAGDRTSRLSPYLHLGCLSPVEVITRAGADGPHPAPGFVRQIAWRDFHHQGLAARPASTRRDYRTRGDRWRRPGSDFEAWQAGRTGPSRGATTSTCRWPAPGRTAP